MNLTTLNPVMLIVIVVAELANVVSLWKYIAKMQKTDLLYKFS